VDVLNVYTVVNVSNLRMNYNYYFVLLEEKVVLKFLTRSFFTLLQGQFLC